MTTQISDRKLAANRANARKSTGPKTVEGKRRSSSNALTHGLTAFVVPLAGPARRHFRQLESELHLRYQPINALEDSFVRRAVLAHFSLAQAGWILQGYWDLTEHPTLPEPKRVTERHRCRRLAQRLLDDNSGKHVLGLILRYQQAARREIALCEKQLESLRASERETKPIDHAVAYLARQHGRQGLYRDIRREAASLTSALEHRPAPLHPPRKTTA